MKQSNLQRLATASNLTALVATVGGALLTTIFVLTPGGPAYLAALGITSAVKAFTVGATGGGVVGLILAGLRDINDQQKAAANQPQQKLG